jgi:hypothetical protein
MGQLAMMDTMGQAAALTGGYGNSYASTAGNQAYQAYLQQLNNVVPELYGMALDQYNAEGDKLLTQYSMLGDMADDEYGKYQDALAQYWQNVNYQKQNADAAYDRGYTDWLNSYQMSVDAENTAYSKQQAEYEKLVSLITSTGYAPTAAELEAAGMSKNQAAAYADYYKKQNTVITDSRSSDDGNEGITDDNKRGYDNGNVSDTNIKYMQQVLGVNPDGKWGPKSQSEAQRKWGTTSADEAFKKYQQQWNGGIPTAGTRIVDDLNKYIRNGASKSEINTYLRSAYQSGYISQERYNQLREQYVPKGQIY